MNKMPKLLKSVIRTASIGLGAASLAWSPASSAALIATYSNPAAWAAAAGTPIALEDFTSATLVPGLTINSLGGGSISSGPTGQINNALAVFGLCINGGTGCPATTMFSFSPGTTAFAADWDLSPGGPGSGIDFSVTLQGGGAPQFVPGITNPPTGGSFIGFFGFVSDTTFTSISLGSGITGNGETFNADNLQFRTTGGDGAVPEPATLALLGVALLGIVALRKRKQT